MAARFMRAAVQYRNSGRRNFNAYMDYGNIATIIISVVLMIVVAAVIVGMVRGKRKGKTSCGCGCASCPAGSGCAMKSVF